MGTKHSSSSSPAVLLPMSLFVKKMVETGLVFEPRNIKRCFKLWGNLNKIWFWQGNSEWGPNYTRLQKLRKNLSEREGGTVHCINSILTSEQNVSKRNIHAERESKPLHPGDWNLDSLPDRHLSSIPLQPLTCQAESPSYRRPSENTAFANLWPFFFSAEIPMLSHFIFQSSEGKV